MGLEPPRPGVIRRLARAFVLGGPLAAARLTRRDARLVGVVRLAKRCRSRESAQLPIIELRNWDVQPMDLRERDLVVVESLGNPQGWFK
jgi:hypothetical protein